MIDRVSEELNAFRTDFSRQAEARQDQGSIAQRSLLERYLQMWRGKGVKVTGSTTENFTRLRSPEWEVKTLRLTGCSYATSYRNPLSLDELSADDRITAVVALESGALGKSGDKEEFRHLKSVLEYQDAEYLPMSPVELAAIVLIGRMRSSQIPQREINPNIPDSQNPYFEYIARFRQPAPAK